MSGLEVANAGSGPDRLICADWDRATVCGVSGEVENTVTEKLKARSQGP